MNELNSNFILSYETNKPLILIKKSTNQIMLKHPIEIHKEKIDDDITSKDIYILQTYGGLLITIFNDEGIWYCLTDTGFIEMPEDIKNIINKLNINYYYFFMINNNQLVQTQNKINLIYTKETYKFTEINLSENNDFKYILQKRLYFSCFNDILQYIHNISYKNYVNKKISLEGIMIRFPDDTYIKVESECFKKINALKPNYKNINIGYLDLYKKDKLTIYLPYYSDFSNDILKRINISLKTLSEEILTIYHLTRNKKNVEIFNALPDEYKKILYDIHGIYITSKNINDDTSSINIHNIYYYLKKNDIDKIVTIYKMRQQLENNILFNNIINKNCIYSKTQTLLLNS
jgi:hypothetical protein